MDQPAPPFKSTLTIPDSVTLAAGDILTMDVPRRLRWWERALIRWRLVDPPEPERRRYVVATLADTHANDLRIMEWARGPWWRRMLRR